MNGVGHNFYKIACRESWKGCRKSRNYAVLGLPEMLPVGNFHEFVVFSDILLLSVLSYQP